MNHKQPKILSLLVCRILHRNTQGQGQAITNYFGKKTLLLLPCKVARYKYIGIIFVLFVQQLSVMWRGTYMSCHRVRSRFLWMLRVQTARYRHWHFRTLLSLPAFTEESILNGKCIFSVFLHDVISVEMVTEWQINGRKGVVPWCTWLLTFTQTWLDLKSRSQLQSFVLVLALRPPPPNLTQICWKYRAKC